MKKYYILALILPAIFGVSMAQEVKTYSVYDTNQSDDLTISDVTAVVDNVKKSVDPVAPPQYVTAEELKALLSAIYEKLEKLNGVEAHLAAIEENLGIGPSYPVTAQFEDITINGKTYHLGVSGAINLGLSVKWATYNVGASNPGEYGDYFAWGETETKSNYNWDTYFDSDFDKYATDRKTVLDPWDDIAHIKWGGDWRMPTRAEQNDLRTKCTWVWTQYGGHNGYVVIGSTSNAIFLPAAGYRGISDLYSADSHGEYWSSSLYANDSDKALGLVFYSGEAYEGYNYRYCGQPVRPVCP